MFYGNFRSYIEFLNTGGLDTQFSITLMCWVQPGGQNGALFNYISTTAVSNGNSQFYEGVHMGINEGKLFFRIVARRFHENIRSIKTPEVLPVGKWVHVAASYDHSSGRNSLYLNGHLKASHNIDRGYQILTNTQKVLMGSRSGSDNKNFTGKIAEMKVYDIALNEAQIQTSIRQGNCTFPIIVVSLPSPMIPLIIETLVIEQPRKR